MRQFPSQRLHYVSALALLLVVFATATAAARTPIVKSKRPIGLNADHGVLAWSSWDAVRHNYRLTLRVNGRSYQPKIPGRTVPFDVDVGTDASGKKVVVYSRCRYETTGFISAGTGCDLWALRLGRYTERRLAASTRAGSETNPSMEGKRLAFVRVHEKRRGLAGVLPYLVLRSGGNERRVAGGPRGTYSGLRTYPGGKNPRPPRASDDVSEGPEDVNLGRLGITYVWSQSGYDCPDGSRDEIPVRSQIRLVRMSQLRSSSLLDEGCSSGTGKTQVFAAAASGRRLGWLIYEGGADAVRVLDGANTATIGFGENVFPAELALDASDLYLGTNGFAENAIAVRRYSLSALPGRFDR